MKEEKIFVVYSYGGEYEDKWETIECAFTSKEKAIKYIEDREKENGAISNEKYYEIRDYIQSELCNIYYKYFDPETDEPLNENSSLEYDLKVDEFEDITKYEIIKEKFGFTKEEWDRKEDQFIWGFCGYSYKEITMFCE